MLQAVDALIAAWEHWQYTPDLEPDFDWREAMTALIAARDSMP